MLKHTETTIRVAGRGTTKAQAFADALSRIQRTIIEGSERVLLRIEPKDISVVEAQEVTRIEKFLFFFLPKERKRYLVKLDVVVTIAEIDLNQIKFSVQIDKSL